MALQVTSAALGDITSGVLLSSLRIVSNASQRAATCDFTYRHATNVLAPEDEISVYDGATRVFRGSIRNRKRTDTGPGPGRAKAQGITCQDVTTWLADDVIDATLVLAAGQSDQAMIDTVVAYTHRGITSGHTYNQVTKASMPAAIDVSGLTIYDAIRAISEVTGASFYVDDSLRVHNYTAESATAPFAIVDNAANGSTRIGLANLVLPDDTFDLVNAVWVIGGTGTTPEWRPPTGTWPTASHTAYGRRERTLRLPNVTSQGELQAAGDAVIANQASPMSPVTCTIYKAGLLAGMNVTLESSLWGINQAYPLAEVAVTVTPGTKSLQYDLTLGDMPSDLGSMLQAVAQGASDAVQGVLDAVGPDTTPPATVTGLGLATGLTVEPDGTSLPFLEASWNASGASDLDAYELEVDQAIGGRPTFSASASGSGGTLGAGTYTVVVTGLGGVAGETAGDLREVVVTAGQHLYVNITALAGCTQYRVYAQRADTPHLSLTTATTGSNVDVTPEGSSGATPPSESSAVDFGTAQAFRTTATKVVVAPVQGGTWYQARVRAVDRAGNRSATWSALAALKTARDTTAPAIPTGLAAVGGYRLLGITWNRNSEADLATYQVRYAPAATPPSDPSAWTVLNVQGTIAVPTGLTPDQVYVVQVRAVDRSGNCRTSEADPTAVVANDNLGAGWSNTSSPYIVATPNLIGAADLAVNSVVTALLTAGTISADAIEGGSLTVGGLAGATTQVAVYDSAAHLAGLWADSGLVIFDTSDPDRAIRLANGVLEFTTDYTAAGGPHWSTALDAEGITANAIMLGSLSGGPNSIPNAGMELTDYATLLHGRGQSPSWDIAADWAANILTASYQVNVDRSTGDLKLTAYT